MTRAAFLSIEQLTRRSYLVGIKHPALIARGYSWHAAPARFVVSQLPMSFKPIFVLRLAVALQLEIVK